MFGAVDVRTNAPTGTTTSITASPGLTVTPTTFNNFTQIGVNFPTANLGYIDVRVGNLTKRITVERKPGTGSAAGELADFSQGNYVIGSVVNNGRDTFMVSFNGYICNRNSLVWRYNQYVYILGNKFSYLAYLAAIIT